MATDSTLQKIADNLLAQFDKTLLDNSTDFSSCDQILNAAPSEHKGGLESLYCDLLLDALISGYYRYSEMDTKQLVDDPLYTKFKKMVYGLDRSDPYNLLYYAIIDLVSGKKENVLQYLSAYLDEKIKSLKTESGIFTAEDFTYILVVPLKECWIETMLKQESLKCVLLWITCIMTLRMRASSSHLPRSYSVIRRSC